MSNYPFFFYHISKVLLPLGLNLKNGGVVRLRLCEHDTSPFVTMNYKILIPLIYILYAGMEFYWKKVIQQVFLLCKFIGRGRRPL